jgi:hypothetical protein
METSWSLRMSLMMITKRSRRSKTWIRMQMRARRSRLMRARKKILFCQMMKKVILMAS